MVDRSQSLGSDRRHKVFCTLVHVCIELKRLRSYNMLGAVVCGLHHECVAALLPSMEPSVAVPEQVDEFTHAYRELVALGSWMDAGRDFHTVATDGVSRALPLLPRMLAELIKFRSLTAEAVDTPNSSHQVNFANLMMEAEMAEGLLSCRSTYLPTMERQLVPQYELRSCIESVRQVAVQLSRQKAASDGLVLCVLVVLVD